MAVFQGSSRDDSSRPGAPLLVIFHHFCHFSITFAPLFRHFGRLLRQKRRFFCDASRLPPAACVRSPGSPSAPGVPLRPRTHRTTSRPIGNRGLTSEGPRRSRLHGRLAVGRLLRPSGPPLRRCSPRPPGGLQRLPLGSETESTRPPQVSPHGAPPPPGRPTSHGRLPLWRWWRSSGKNDVSQTLPRRTQLNRGPDTMVTPSSRGPADG